MIKKLSLGLLCINLFANNILMFEEINLNGKKILIQQNISKNLEDVTILRNFEYETKGLIKIANNYAKNEKLFNSVDDRGALKQLHYLLVKVVKTNGFLWDKAVSYQGKEYAVLYNFLDKVLLDKKLLLTSTEDNLSNKLVKKDLIDRTITLQNDIIRQLHNKHKLNKNDIQKVRAFYVVLSQVIQDYKKTINNIENLTEVKIQISKNKKLKQAFDEINSKINNLQKSIQEDIVKLNEWTSIKIF